MPIIPIFWDDIPRSGIETQVVGAEYPAPGGFVGTRLFALVVTAGREWHIIQRLAEHDTVGVG